MPVIRRFVCVSSAPADWISATALLISDELLSLIPPLQSRQPC
ncbi:hypothetical protein ABH940_006693 [Streptacidiphilus sp. BW17]